MQNMAEASQDSQIALLAARYVFADELARRSGNPRQKLATGTLKKVFCEATKCKSENAQKLALAVLIYLRESRENATAIIAELVFTPPFAPHDISVDDSELQAALPILIDAMGLKIPAMLPWKLKTEAQKAYGQRRKGAALGILGLGVAAAALLIPVVGPAISGYAGAAALTSTLAFIGGSLQGGMLLLGVGGLMGGSLLVSGLGQAIRVIGVSGLRLELMKLEVNQRLQWPFIDLGGDQAIEVTKNLMILRKEHEETTRREAEISDAGSKLVSGYRDMIKLYDIAIKRFQDWSGER